ncbi:hypothetical protein HW132_35150, partial [Brasilonema sp. CT11]|nr:hypothetical protein [Brasilonema sp. CT11]
MTFQLINLKVSNREKVLFDVPFSGEMKREKLLSTVIIGINGSGKSYLLTIITEVFRALENLKKGREYSLRYDRYNIEYLLNNSIYKISIKKKLIDVVANNKTLTSFEQLELPSNILAVSFMVNDKFVFKQTNAKSDEFYEYFGIRRTSNATWINTISKKLSETFIENTNKQFIKKLKQILKFLNFDSKISLVFEPTRKTLFTRTLTVKQINARLKKIKQSDDLTVSTIRKITSKQINDLCTFVNKTAKNRTREMLGDKVGLKYLIQFENNESSLGQDYDYLKLLMDLEYIEPPRIYLYKYDEEFDFDYAS